MFRLHEVEPSDEKEITQRILSNAHAALDAKFPETKIKSSHVNAGFDAVEDTISEEDDRPNPTPGVPETRDAMPITKTGRLDGAPPEKQDYNKDLGEFTQFSLDEPTQLTEKNKLSGSASTKALTMFILLLIAAAAGAAYWFFLRK